MKWKEKKRKVKKRKEKESQEKKKVKKRKNKRWVFILDVNKTVSFKLSSSVEQCSGGDKRYSDSQEILRFLQCQVYSTFEIMTALQVLVLWRREVW
jgi:hypothetical protein